MLDTLNSMSTWGTISLGESQEQLSFSKTPAELANLPNFPHSVKIKNPLNVSKF